MSSASELRRRLESALAERIPSALSFRAPVAHELLSSGIEAIDEALGGGFPLGAITELAGPGFSGRTTLVLATLAAVTRLGGSCAYVDASDTLDPASAAALGVDLRRLLWVRAGAASYPELDKRQLWVPEPGPEPGLTAGRLVPGGRGGRHPRAEAVGMDRAVGEMLGTASGRDPLKPKETLSGAPGQKQLPRSARKDKAFYDDHTGQAESHDYTPRCAESVRRPRPEPVLVMPPPVERARLGSALPPPRREWKPGLSALDRAWRATDLLLNTGGFQAVVLDLGDTPAEDAGRVPLATWYRFRLQVEKARALFLLVARAGCAGGCAALSIKLDRAEPDWRRANGASPALLAGVRCRVTIERHRTAASGGKKPAACAPCSWTSAAPWTR